MPKFSALLVAAMLGALVSPPTLPSAHAAPAATFSSKKDGYSIYLPGKPQSASRQMALPNMGSMKVNFISLRKPPVAYVVIPMTLPGKPTGATIDQFLNGVQTGFTASAAAKLISSKKISLNGAPGREVLVQVGDSLMHGRFFVKGSRSYQVIAIAPRANNAKYAPQISQVLDSFRILG